MKLTYFYLPHCPYCGQANAWIEELKAENPAYLAVGFEKVLDSEADPTYDYWYVPCFFDGNKKLHEGAATKEKIRAVLEAALKSGEKAV